MLLQVVNITITIFRNVSLVNVDSEFVSSVASPCSHLFTGMTQEWSGQGVTKKGKFLVMGTSLVQHLLNPLVFTRE